MKTLWSCFLKFWIFFFSHGFVHGNARENMRQTSNSRNNLKKKIKDRSVGLLLFCFFFRLLKKKLNFQLFCLGDRFLSSSGKLVSVTVFSPKFFSPAAGWLNLKKTCLSDRIFPGNFFACGRLINLRVTFGILFTQKAVWKTPLSSVFQTAFWVKKEFPNVTYKLISPPQAKKYGRWDKFSRRREKTVTETEKLVVYLQKKWKIIVSVTVNSVALLQKNTSQWQTFREMKLKIKKTKKKKTILVCSLLDRRHFMKHLLRYFFFLKSRNIYVFRIHRVVKVIIIMLKHRWR